jgi:hypothetical protein
MNDSNITDLDPKFKYILTMNWNTGEVRWEPAVCQKPQVKITQTRKKYAGK